MSLLSATVLTLAPLLVLGLKSARSGQNDEVSAQIAQTLGEQARQHTLSFGTLYLDGSGNICTPAQARYQVLASSDSPTTAVTRVILRVTPVGAPAQGRTYAVMLPAQS